MSNDSQSDNVIYANFVTTLDIPVERILEGARKQDLRAVIVIGITQDGEDYYAASTGDAGLASILLQRANWDVVQNAE